MSKEYKRLDKVLINMNVPYNEELCNAMSEVELALSQPNLDELRDEINEYIYTTMRKVYPLFSIDDIILINTVISSIGYRLYYYDIETDKEYWLKIPNAKGVRIIKYFMMLEVSENG